MGRCRVVTPDQVRLPLSEGDWIEVKRELNAGEYYDQLVATSERRAFAKPIAYLLRWSLIDIDGTSLPYSADDPEEQRRGTIRSLDQDTIRELIAVIDRHEQAQDAARAAKKNAPDTSSESKLTSASAD